jgi:hypothetical protein
MHWLPARRILFLGREVKGGLLMKVQATVVNRLHLWKGTIALLLFQVSPFDVRPDSAGVLRLTIGYAAGQYENVSYGCSGDAYDSYPIAYRGGGALVEYWGGYHLTGGVSLVNFDDRRHFAGSVLVAREGERGGIGLGMARITRDADGEFGNHVATKFSPSSYLRVGSPAGWHLRADSHYPTFAAGMTGERFRIGLGISQTRGARFSGFFGHGETPYGEGGWFGEVSFSISSRLGFTVAGRTQQGYEYRDGGFGIGVRYQLRP